MIPSFRCGSDRLSRATMEQIRASHVRMLTVDGNIGSGAAAKVLSRMEAGGLDAAFFVVPVAQGGLSSEAYEKARETAFNAIRSFKRTIELRPKLIGLGRGPEDAYRLEKGGRHAAYLGLGNGYAIGADLSLISAYYEEGVRYMTLCGDSDNAICDSAFERTHTEDRGLSDFGRKVVAECNRRGMTIDLANCSEKSFLDVLDASRAPVIVSHSAVRALSGRPGNLSDEMILAIVGRGGVILVSLQPKRLLPGGRGSGADVSNVVDHIDYIKSLAGIEAVGIGSGFGDGGGVSGCREPGEFLNLTTEMLRRGYGEYSIESVWGGNLMRVFGQAEITPAR